jgi:hypothetical protein
MDDAFAVDSIAISRITDYLAGMNVYVGEMAKQLDELTTKERIWC